VLSHRLHELGLSGRKLAKVDKLRRNVNLRVCGPRRVVPGVMHCPTGDPTGLADERGVLLADVSRLGLGPGEVVVDLLLDSAECFGESDAFALGLVRPATPDGSGELLVGGVGLEGGGEGIAGSGRVPLRGCGVEPSRRSLRRRASRPGTPRR
jgi:hypothetical protein